MPRERQPWPHPPSSPDLLHPPHDHLARLEHLSPLPPGLVSVGPDYSILLYDGAAYPGASALADIALERATRVSVRDQAIVLLGEERSATAALNVALEALSSTSWMTRPKLFSCVVACRALVQAFTTVVVDPDSASLTSCDPACRLIASQLWRMRVDSAGVVCGIQVEIPLAHRSQLVRAALDSRAKERCESKAKEGSPFQANDFLAREGAFNGTTRMEYYGPRAAESESATWELSVAAKQSVDGKQSTPWEGSSLGRLRELLHRAAVVPAEQALAFIRLESNEREGSIMCILPLRKA